MKTIGFIVSPAARPMVSHAEMVELLRCFYEGRIRMQEVIWRLESWAEDNAARAVACERSKP